jgi:exosome complex RNA-binding protein Rrp4
MSSNYNNGKNILTFSVRSTDENDVASLIILTKFIRGRFMNGISVKILNVRVKRVKVIFYSIINSI